MAAETFKYNGRLYRNVTREFLDMGRRKRTRMTIVDMKVENGKCVISLQLKRGAHVWKKAYGFDAKQLREGEFDIFVETLKNKAHEDALKLEEDANFEDRVLMRIEQHIGQEIFLD